MHPLIRRSVAVGLVASLGGCQAYTAFTPDPSAVRSTARVSFTDRATLEGHPPLTGGLRAVEGQIVGVSDTTLVMRVTDITDASGLTAPWSGPLVTVPRSDIAKVERRDISMSRSVGLAAVLVGGALLASRGFGSGSTQGGQRNTGGTIQ